MQLIVARPIDNCVFAVLNISNSRGVERTPAHSGESFLLQGEQHH